MTPTNPSLIIGLLLAGLPVVLHLMMRAKPKRIEFPALRLLQSRQTSNTRRMRLRHLLLLLLRILLIVAAVICLVRPRLPPAHYGLRWWERLILIIVAVSCAGIYYYISHRMAASDKPSERHRESIQKLRIWCLLGGLLTALLTVGAPWGLRVQAELASPQNNIAENIPVAAVFIFDTSLSMEYQHESRSRLEHAQEVADKHLSNLPQRSRVAVASLASDDEIVFQADLSGVRSRINSLETEAVTQKLNRQIRDAVNAQVEDMSGVNETGSGSDTPDAFSREIYIFTDLSETAWQSPDETGLKALLSEHEWLQVYLVDVGVDNPVNLSLSLLKLSEESTVAGREVIVSATVTATGDSKKQTTVEAYTIDRQGQAVRTGAPSIVRFEGSPPVSQFTIPALSSTQYQEGYLQISSTDPLQVDDTLYFAFGIRPRPRILFVSDSEDQSRYLRNALQPTEYDRLGILHYECKNVSTAQYSSVNVNDYDIVCVVNCADPDASMWSSLLKFVQSGGSVLVTLGGSFDLKSESWWTSDSQRLLPALPVVPIAFRENPGYLRIEQGHPITQRFESDTDTRTALFTIPFYWCWSLEIHNDSSTLMTFEGPRSYPALMERHIGEGRCLLFASAVDYIRNGGAEWNELAAEWIFVDLAEQTASYLSGANDQRHNFTAGETVEVRVPASKRFAEYLIARPKFRQTSGTLDPDQVSVLVDDAEQIGSYQMRPSGDPDGFQFAFAMNMTDSESDLTEIEDATLDDILGKDRYSRVINPEQLDRVVQAGRLGIEVFPVLLGLLIILFCAEHLMANFFYDTQPDTATT